jgi:FixJ family two-component response regulator
MTTRRVIFLDDDPDLREVFAALMSSLGITATPVASVSELTRMMGDQPDGGFDLAILDINLGAGSPSGLAAYRWLRDHQFEGRIVFLTGHARSHPLVVEASHIGDAIVCEKPMTAAQLRALMV